MTDQDKLAALAEAATPGPFSEEGGYIKAGKAALTTVADVRYKNGDADRAFIVALVNAYWAGELVPVRERDELRAAVEPFASAFDRDRMPVTARRDYQRASAALHSKDGASCRP